MLYLVRALWSRGGGECHSQRADLVLIKSIHCSSEETRPAVWGYGATQPPDIKQNRTAQGDKERLDRLRLSSTQH